MAKVGSETICGTVPDHGSQHEVGVRGITARKKIKSINAIWCIMAIFIVGKIG